MSKVKFYKSFKKAVRYAGNGSHMCIGSFRVRGKYLFANTRHVDKAFVPNGESSPFTAQDGAIRRTFQKGTINGYPSVKSEYNQVQVFETEIGRDGAYNILTDGYRKHIAWVQHIEGSPYHAPI